MTQSSNPLVGLIAILALAYVLIVVMSYLFQSRMIYIPDFPSRELVATPERLGMSYENVSLRTEDDIALHGWFIPAGNAKFTLLFFHGNAGNISHRRESIEIFHRLGLNVLIFDYRGYGQSKGKPSEQGLYQDATAAWRYLTEQKGFAPEQIIIFGRSLGGTIAARLAAGVQARGLILESTMSSARDFAKQVFKVLARLVVIRYDFNTAEYIRHVNVPVLVLHSPDDEIMPFNLGEKVFESANQPKQFVHMRGDHNSGFYLSQPEYEQQLAGWIGTL